MKFSAIPDNFLLIIDFNYLFIIIFFFFFGGGGFLQDSEHNR